MKIVYYTNRISENIKNTKKMWGIINEILKKQKKRGSIITHINVNGVKTYDSCKIANEFGNFYSTLGYNLSTKIKGGTSNISHYLGKIPINSNSMIMNPTSEKEIQQLMTLNFRTSPAVVMME